MLVVSLFYFMPPMFFFISCNFILLLKLEFHTMNLKNLGKIKTEDQCLSKTSQVNSGQFQFHCDFKVSHKGCNI